MNSAFASIVGEYQEASEGLDLAGDWMPDHGQYNVLLKEVTTGVRDETGNAWVRPTFEIIDGDLATRVFTDLYVFKPGKADDKKSFPAMKNLALLATTIAGREIKQVQKGIAILEAGIGTALSLVVGSRKAKDGRMFDTIKFGSRIDN